MENIELAIALIAVVIECFAFALALACAPELCALIYAIAPCPRERTRPSARTLECARCGARFATDTDAAYCGFCAVVVLYEHHDRIANLLAPNPFPARDTPNVRARQRAGINVCARKGFMLE